MGANESVKIPALNGESFFVSKEDAEWVSSYNWGVCHGYVVRYYKIEGRSRKVSLHREILKVSPSKFVDHIDHNKLNNARENLRIVDHSKNQMNRLKTNGSSIFKGVHWAARKCSWIAKIKKHGVVRQLGRFDNEQEAAHAYNKAAIELFGEYACLNPIGEPYEQA